MHKPTNDQITQLFGCSTQQVQCLFAKNAASLSEMACKAERSGKRVNGYTAEQLHAAANQAAVSSKR